MSKDYLLYENKLFEFLLKTFSKSKKISLSNDFIPEGINENLFKVNHTPTGDVWLMCIPVNNNEIFYYFGVSKFRSKTNDDIFLRLILKVSSDEEKSFIKFLDNDNVAIEFKIKNGDKKVYDFLKDNFNLISCEKNSDRYLIILGNLNTSKIILNIRNLVKKVEFDLNLKNDVLVVNNIIKFNYKFQSLKINSNRKVSDFENLSSNKLSSKSNSRKKKYRKKPKRQIKSRPSRGKEIIKNSSDKFNLSEKSSNNIENDILNEQVSEKISEILGAIDEGYKYIIFESWNYKSEIIKILSRKYKDSLVLSDNKFYRLENEANYDDAITKFKSKSKINKRKLIIFDEAHKIEEKIVDLFSIEFGLVSIVNDLSEEMPQIESKLKKLKNKDSKAWLKFFNEIYSKYAKLIKNANENHKNEFNSTLDEIQEVIEFLEDNTDSLCSYRDDDYYFGVSFRPIYVDKLVQKFLLNQSEICIFMSSTILNYEKFTKELGIDSSKVKFISDDLKFDVNKTKIYSRNSVNMDNKFFNYNSKLLIPLIEKILEKHVNDKGLIYTGNSTLKNFIRSKIKNNRLIIIDNTSESSIESFKRSKKSVLVEDSIMEGVKFNDDNCRFQIILKQPLDSWNKRAKLKNELEHDWYDYRTAINLVQLLGRTIGSENDYCTTYMLDERFIGFLHKDVSNYEFIPKFMINAVVDLDLTKQKLICNSIKKEFGIYYLFDYIPDTRLKNKSQKFDSKTLKLSKKLQKYKDYPSIKSNIVINEFNFFTKKLIHEIDEFSEKVIPDEINKIALVAVPSSTIERDKSAAIRESIKCIVNYYTDVQLGSNKKLINCSDLLYRFSSVQPSHKNKRRISYGEHKNSIKCRESDVMKMQDVVFVILDDISTRGTILNACEDILIENGVKKENIYKFVIGKTVGYDDKF